MPPSARRSRRRLQVWVPFVLFTGVLAYACTLLVMDTDLAGRVVTLRFWSLLAAATFAVLPPHVLFPDPNFQLLPLFNPDAPALLAHQFRRWAPVPAALAAPCFMLAYFDPGGFSTSLTEKTETLAASLMIVVGLGLYSFARYARLGQVSQEWQEGKRGRLYRAVSRNTPFRYEVSDGLVPSIQLTQHVFLIGVILVVATSYLTSILPGLITVLPGFALLGWTALLLARQRAHADRAFYQTNAFYSEVFRGAGSVRSSSREPIVYEAVYWTPHRWRPHVWATLRQFDRRLPLGRFIALGHLLLWILFFQGAGSDVIAAYLLLFSGIKNAAVYLSGTEALAPSPFNLTHQTTTGWTLTRFFVNIRWTLPFLLSLLVIAVFSDRFGAVQVASWTALDVLLSFLTAWSITYFHEFQYAKRYA